MPNSNPTCNPPSDITYDPDKLASLASTSKGNNDAEFKPRL
ncbi:hypothetical protein V202x_41730 [Gimesia aquarii]|uniref:Uncharacterized protein n=1 Tax=Gimesia aquarii TaxID=2527964 RepID=A0A517WZT7_9PLAN|nr:hypothetical protein V202x_41730 [Gimesia aquarii]